jgi:hypothetical protein
MTARRSASPSKGPAVAAPTSAPAASATNAALKLRVKPMMSSSKMYVCRRCQANFKTGDGKPDSRLPGLGKCNKCLAAQAASALAA